MSAGRSAPAYDRRFGDLAARYDGLRPDTSDAATEILLREGDLRGRRVPDVGCCCGGVAALAGWYGADRLGR